MFNATTGALRDTVNNPTPADDDEFGVSMAVSGTTVVVGAQKDDTQNTDQGAAYVYSIAAPTVQSLRVNDGSVQRSQVKGLAVTFDAQVSFAGTVAQAFTLSRNGGKPVAFTATSSVINGVTVVSLSNFTGAETQFGSLGDGRYTLPATSDALDLA